MSRNVLTKTSLAAAAAFLVATSAQAGPLSLQDVPLYLLSRADPNVLLEMSVETPMGGAAYTDNVGNPTGCTGRRNDVLGDTTADDIGSCYVATAVYLGYFDPKKCYSYSSSRFNPSGAATASHTCTTAWSGNFLNWATMTAIDMFTWTMTGGNRVVDSTSETVVRRARKQDNNSWFPRKVVNSTINVAPNTVTPYSNTTLFIHNTAYGFNVGADFASATSGAGVNFIGNFSVDVKVCDASVGIESNCVAYGSSPLYYKPEGLIQGNASAKRFAVTSYTFDGSQERDGGVLRSNMKYVGPKLPDGSTNPKKEYGTDGLLINNPDGATGGLNSGVINYVNKFSDPGYKTYDPIGELFYESLRFFKHLAPTPEYSSGLTTAQCGGFQVLTTWEDPIQYRCQKNFIIAINDANPWLDKKLPGTYFTSLLFGGLAPTYAAVALTANDYGEPSNPDTSINVRTLTNRVGELEGLNGQLWSSTGTWTSGTVSGTKDSVGGGFGTFDNSCSDKTVAALGEVMGTCPSPSKQNSYYVAGLAYYANTNDLRSDLANDRGIQNVASFVIDTQEFSTNPLDGPRNMLWLAGKYGGFVDANNDGIPQTAEWDSDSDGVPDNYVLATKPQNLVNGLSRAFDFIDSQTSSASSASVNAGSISSSTRVYQALFNSSDWTGQLLAKPVLTDGSGGLGTLQWDAETLVPAAASRVIITHNADTDAGVAFKWTKIGAIRQGQLDFDGLGSNRLSYLRGAPDNERPAGPFRKRAKKLGDIINSEPVFVGKPPFLYTDSSYTSFRDDNASRTQMVYVGANDGMLHAFNASTGVEAFAFIPGAVFRNLRELSKPNYSHQYYVDGSPTMGDVYYGGKWHTVLVGGLNKGGQGIYALDITDPTKFSESVSDASGLYRWEFTDTDDPDLGYTFSRPAIVKMANGKWAAVFGNGYNNTFDDTATGGQKSSTGQAALYIIDIQTGDRIAKIDTNVGTANDPLALSRPNGLATPAAVDLNGDGVIDYIYGGDLFGNLWKFDVRDADPANWNVAHSAPFFSAVDKDGKAQPITTRPEVGRGPNGRGMVILFGTGKFLEAADKDVSLLTTQSFYGVYDANASTTTVISGRSELTQQEITYEAAATFASKTFPVRVTTQKAVANRGWYMDLLSAAPGVPPPAGFKGEMQVSDPILRNGRIMFTTLIPTPDPCAFGGKSWLMELDAVTGGRLNYAPLDLNNDSLFDTKDYVTLPDGTKMAVSGMQSDVGITAKPGILSGSNADYLYMSGSGSQTVGENNNMQVQRANPGPGDVGRQSWRQMR